MTTIEEFNETFNKFKQFYEECNQLLAKGIEQETKNEDAVSNFI